MKGNIISMDLSNIDFSNLIMPTLPNISMIPSMDDVRTTRITSAISEMDKQQTIREIENLRYELRLISPWK